ncbi:MAG: hypothetical protein HGA38_02350 [Candidatus Moranbacteria bacterium]|nr:hypothetical protein [Candidatus Moranbacteria bacterium]
MAENSKKLDYIVKISFIIAIFIVALSVSYYYAIFLPAKELARTQQQNRLEQAKKECAQFVIDASKKNAVATASDYNAINSICMGKKGF